MWEDNGMDFLTGESVMDFGDLFHTNAQFFTSLDVNWCTGVDYCDVFIRCLDFDSDGTHSLKRSWCDANFLLNLLQQINKLMCILDGVNFQQI